MWKCKKCNSEVEDNFEICWNCGAAENGEDSINQEVKKVASEIKADIVRHQEANRYPALRTISLLFKICGYFIFILTIIALVLQAKEQFSNTLTIIGTIAIGLMSGLTLLAISEGIIVLVDIEENTRKSRRNSKAQLAIMQQQQQSSAETQKILIGQLSLIAGIAEKTGVPIADINEVVTDYGIEYD
jgi:hypothetical protein